MYKQSNGSHRRCLWTWLLHSTGRLCAVNTCSFYNIYMYITFMAILARWYQLSHVQVTQCMTYQWCLIPVSSASVLPLSISLSLSQQHKTQAYTNLFNPSIRHIYPQFLITLIFYYNSNNPSHVHLDNL